MNLFIGDSLGLPKPDFNVRFEDTIPCYLANSGNVWMLSHTGATVREFKDIVTELSHLLPDHFFNTTVIQLGLSDCAPRPLAIQWRNQLTKVRPVSLRSAIISLLHKYRPFIQKHIGYHQRTPYGAFKQNFSKVLKMVSVLSENIFVVLMPPVRDSLEQHSPGIGKEIAKYNECMKELSHNCGAEVVDAVGDLRARSQECLTNDGHLAKEGQRVLLSKLRGATR